MGQDCGPLGAIRQPLTRGTASGDEPLLTGKRYTSRTLLRGAIEFPDVRRHLADTAVGPFSPRHCSREGIPIGAITYPPHRSSAVYRQTDRAAQNLRRPGGHRDRERAPVQGIAGAQRRIARGPGASDGDGRGARHHQPLADGRAAGPRRHRRERRPGLRNR